MTLKRFAWGIAALLVAAAALLVLGDWLLGTPAVKAAVQQRVSAALGGQIAWEDLELRLLPAPRGELRTVRIEIPGVLALRADQVDAYLRLWPLLRGQVEIASFSAQRPQIRLTAAAPAEQGPVDPLVAYRRVVEPVARALQRFAPDTRLSIESAEIALPEVQLRGLNATASTSGGGLDLQAETASNLWQRLQVKGRLVYADLSAQADVEVDGLVLDRELPPAKLSMRLHTDANSSIEADLDAVLGSLAREAKAKLLLPAGKPLEATAHLSAVDLAGALAIARRKVSGLEAIESADGRLSAKVHVVLGEAWRAQAQIVESDAAVRLAPLPWKLSLRGGHVMLDQREVRIRGAHGALGDSAFSEVAAQIALGRPARLSAASGKANLRLEQWFPWLQQRLPLQEVGALSGNLDVALQRMALRFDRPGDVSFDAVATPRKVSASLSALPAPLSVAGGSVRVTPQRAQLDKVAVAMLDASALLSGSVERQGPRVELAAGEGVLGEKFVQWAMQRSEVAANFEPKTPLRFAARRVVWGPGSALDADARIDFDHGPQLDVALGWRPQRFELRRAALKDALSDASFSAVLGEGLLHTGFSGRLDGRSIAAMLRHKLPSSGRARGDLKLTIDRAQPARTHGEGQLAVEALDLSWLAGRRVRVERAQISTQRDDLRLARARIDVEEQVFELEGELRRTEQGPVVNAWLQSAGVEIARLLPARKPGAQGERSALWPLPITGSVTVSAGFVQFARHRIEPLEGVLTFERERAQLEVKQARVCGVSFPLSAEALPDRYTVSALLTMKDEPFEAAMHCLTGGGVQISGNADLRAELRTQGRGEEELIRNLTGSAQGELRKGRVKKFALIGNILSLRDIAALKNVKEDGFAYRSLTADGRFENGEFLLREGFFDSDAARLAANGRIDLYGANSRLTVLVGLLTTVERVVGAIPLVGGIFGGTMVALPVSVTGDIRDPKVVPLGPRAVSDQLLGIFERTLKLPGKLVLPAEKTPPP